MTEPLIVKSTGTILNFLMLTLKRVNSWLFVFALFISLFADITMSTTYADDNCLFGSLETEKKVLENCIKETKSAMKWFLNWYHQTVNAIEKANKAKQALRIISRYFSP